MWITADQAIGAIERAFQSFACSRLDLHVDGEASASPTRLTGHLQIGDESVPIRATVAGQASSRAVAQVAAGAAGKGTLRLLIAPYVGPGVAQAARRAGIGFVDLAGNAFVDVATIHLSVEGREPPPREPSDVSLFSPKASRVARAMLHAPDRRWLHGELVEATDISGGHVSQITRELINSGHADRSGRRIGLVDPGALLDAWAAEYSVRISLTWWHGPTADLRNLTRELAALKAAGEATLAFTGLQAAAMLAPYAYGGYAQCYGDARLPEMLRCAGAVQVDGGGDIAVNAPAWDGGVFLDAREVDGLQIVHPVQIYLDLWRLGDRGREAAEVLRRECLDF